LNNGFDVTNVGQHSPRKSDGRKDKKEGKKKELRDCMFG
jgi:hypothetical protein